MTDAKLRLARSMRGQDPPMSLGADRGRARAVGRCPQPGRVLIIRRDRRSRVRPGGEEVAVTDPTRRLRVVPPLPGQLTLDLPGLPPPLQPVAPAPRRTRPAVLESGPAAGPGWVRRLLPTRPTDHAGPAVVARVPVGVWAVWDGGDLVGVYAQENTARGEAVVLRRDAARTGVRPGSVDYLPLRVFTESQHTRR
jgi:hypothetical protein